ncbi:hypothetical protein LSCM1_07331 [Leishmania martiniquensis]|uniref:Poly(A) RNA polymerase mitochondrial-like central palm domain-containing protein n=1 Tax=Leishmania martiniquensis TaxID=1580590 RepID=A0A836H3I8_9TRYP|nr:hypothetical protein LSCM1_07331 [Leishmania martiniquensis]
MKRRGGRVVSSDSTVVDIGKAAVTPSASGLPTTVNCKDAPITTGAAAAASSSPSVASPTTPVVRDASGVPGSLEGAEGVTAMGSPPPTLTIPTLDIFSRFQSKRDDFDADWLLLQEDPATMEEKPRIAAHVADKLRRHQAQLGAHRAAAAADRTRQDSDRALVSPATAKVSGAVSGDDLGVVATEDHRPARRQRRPETYDSAEESGNDGVGDDGGDDDVEYVPEDRAASQYKRPKMSQKASAKDQGSAGVAVSGGSPPVIRSAGRPAGVAAATAPATDAGTASVDPLKPLSEGEERGDSEAEREGLTGDYLNFHATSAAGRKAVGADEVQATVHVQSFASRGEHRNAGSGSSPRSQEQRRQTTPTSQQAERDRVLVVPLWSIARMEQHGGYCTSSPLIALHQEITDLVDYLRPTEAEVTMRRYIEKEIGRLVDRLWPGSSVLVYGSMYTHLLLPLSDLDVTLLDVPVPAEEALTALAKEISTAGLCESAYPQVILKTKVPLIKFVHKDSLIDVDISVGAVDGRRNSECVVQYIKMYPEALPLILTVKYFLMQRGMHEPYHGGLGSYATTLLVVAFLRQHPIYTTHPEQRGMAGLGKLLVDFFRMCGQYWNYRRVAVCLDNYAAPGDEAGAMGASANGEGDFRVRADGGGRIQSPVSPSSPRGPMGPAQAWIEDPVDPSNNAASSLRLFHSLSSMFAYAYLALTGDVNSAAADESQSQPPTSASSLSSPSSDDISRRPTLLSRIFHADAEMVYRRRAIAATYERLKAEMPVYVKEVRRFRRAEDEAMLQHNCCHTAFSWRARRLLRREGTSFLFPQQRSVTSLEERLALSRLHESSSPHPPESKVGGEKRQREGAREERRMKARKGCREYSAPLSDRSSPSSVRSFDSGSNASSVRVSAMRRTERNRKLHR